MDTVFKDELARVAALVGNELNSDPFPEEVRPAVLGAAVRDYPCRGGKRLRPALVVWSCELFGGSAEQAAPAAAAAEKQPAGPAGTPKRILIADDQKMNLVVLKAMLKKLGTFDIVTAMNGKEALDILTSSDAPFSLILTDMWMPVMDGEGLVRAARADARFAALPIHVVTADTEMQERYREAGFDGIMLKPITVDKLRSIVG